jgi:tricorn protease
MGISTTQFRPDVGERTLGILVGPATGHGLMMGFYNGSDARLYGNTGKWFAEGYESSPTLKYGTILPSW